MFALQKERSFWVPIGVQYIYSIYIIFFCTHVTWKQLTWSDSHDPSSEIWPWQLFLSLPQQKTWPKIHWKLPWFFSWGESTCGSSSEISKFVSYCASTISCFCGCMAAARFTMEPAGSLKKSSPQNEKEKQNYTTQVIQSDLFRP